MNFSCLLFNLVIEVIAEKIRNNEDIEGVVIGTVVRKLGQYADDLWVATKSKRKCLIALLRELDNFYTCTAYRVKSEL